MPRHSREYVGDPHEGPAVDYRVQPPRRGLLLTGYLVSLFGWYIASSCYMWTLTPAQISELFGSSSASINMLIGCFQAPIFPAIYGIWVWERWGIWAVACVLVVNIVLNAAYAQQISTLVNLAFLLGLVLVTKQRYHEFGSSNAYV